MLTLIRVIGILAFVSSLGHEALACPDLAGVYFCDWGSGRNTKIAITNHLMTDGTTIYAFRYDDNQTAREFKASRGGVQNGDRTFSCTDLELVTGTTKNFMNSDGDYVVKTGDNPPLVCRRIRQ